LGSDAGWDLSVRPFEEHGLDWRGPIPTPTKGTKLAGHAGEKVWNTSTVEEKSLLPKRTPSSSRKGKGEADKSRGIIQPKGGPAQTTLGAGESQKGSVLRGKKAVLLNDRGENQRDPTETSPFRTKPVPRVSGKKRSGRPRSHIAKRRRRISPSGGTEADQSTNSWTRNPKKGGKTRPTGKKRFKERIRSESVERGRNP